MLDNGSASISGFLMLADLGTTHNTTKAHHRNQPHSHQRIAHGKPKLAARPSTLRSAMGCIQSRLTTSSIARMMVGYMPSEKLEPEIADLGVDGCDDVDVEAGPDVQTIWPTSCEIPANTQVISKATVGNCFEHDVAPVPKGEQDVQPATPDRHTMKLGPSRNTATDAQAEYEISTATRENELRTPPRPKHVRRRIDGSPILPMCNLPQKTVYLLRHGFSLGQAAQKNGLDRKTAKSLRDCGLTQQGIEEARAIPHQLSEEEIARIQIVFSSPFTRALHTAALGFPSKNIICHFDLGEIGSKAPENTPRNMTSVLRDIHEAVQERDDTCSIDVTTFQPPHWPRDSAPGVIKKEKVKKFLHWLYRERLETAVAVVCHHNVIKTALIEGQNFRPKNAQVIRCTLNSNGELFFNSTS